MKWRKLPLLLLPVLLLVGCQGLPEPREMGDMALLRTMGVDRGADGPALTVSTGPRAKGLEGDNQPALLLSAQVPTLSGGALAIQGQSDSFVFFGYVDQLLLGQALAGEDVLPVLDWFARDIELSLNAQLWLIRDATARQAVESGGEQGVEDRLATLRTDGRLGVGGIPRTAGEVYADLLEQGASYAPALVLGEEAEQASLVAGGYGVFRENRLAGVLEGDAATGLELLAGKPSADVLSAAIGEHSVVVRVYRAVTTSRFDGAGRLNLKCRLWARLAEYDRPLSEAERAALEEQIRRLEETRMKGTLSQLQMWQADCLGLGPKAGLTAPAKWAKLEPDWPQQFARQSPNLTVQVEVVQ